nr:putative oxidoreductase YghA [Paraburkholderia busanensis]
MRANLYDIFWFTKAAIPRMALSAAIVNNPSVSAYDPSANLLAYATTKAAIANFTEALAKQSMERGIRVTAVAPRPFWTPPQVTSGQTTQNVEKSGQQIPMGTLGQPAEIAHFDVDLASTDASYWTGQIYGALGYRIAVRRGFSLAPAICPVADISSARGLPKRRLTGALLDVGATRCSSGTPVAGNLVDPASRGGFH